MSMPFVNKEFTFTQPDGTQFRVRGTGDQYNAVFETLDGFTIVEDPNSGFFQYARPHGDGADLVPTGVLPGSLNPASIGLAAHARPSLAVMRARAAAGPGLPRSPSRWEVRRNQRRMSLQAARGIALAPPQRQTVGTYIGLCLLIQFPDVRGTISQSEVDDFCNKRGYANFGNNGSVCDYFYTISDGKLTYTNVVAPYYTSKFPRSYYTNEQIDQPTRAWELVKEALAHHKNRGFDFTGVTVDDQQYAYALNVFYAGPCINNWAKGLWPHSYHLETPYELAPGKFAYDYQITDMGNELSLGTFCHENEHMICDFPDLYDYGYESNGVGVFCLMCSGGSRPNEKNPGQVGAYLKHSAGWASTVHNAVPGASIALKAGRNEFAIYRRSNSEYFVIENRARSGRDAALADAGLAIWHVDELGSNSNEQMSPSSHYECALVQADGRNDLENKSNYGDTGDLFQNGSGDELSDVTNPHCRWWDGSSSGLVIRNISAAGPSMTFTVGPQSSPNS